jgi:hypothetical protein
MTNPTISWSLSNPWSTADTNTDDSDNEQLPFDSSTTINGNSGHEMIDRTLSQVQDGYPALKDASFLCAPYKTEVFRQQLDEHAPGSLRRTAIISALQDLGVKVFIIDSVSTPSTSDVMHHVRRVVGYMARENQTLANTTGPLGYQRCLLYQDTQGRLFNLLLSRHAMATEPTKYEQQIDSFSALHAIVAMTVLCRLLPILLQSESNYYYDTKSAINPACLAMLAGLVFVDETSLSWLNVSLMVRGVPSLSAHTLMSPAGSDTLRKIVLFAFILAAALTGEAARIATLVGVFGVLSVLLANLGARTTYFLRWSPQVYDGIGASLVAYIKAILTGVFFPWMANRNAYVGGRAGIEYIIQTSFVSAAVYWAAGIESAQVWLIGTNADVSDIRDHFVSQAPSSLSSLFFQLLPPSPLLLNVLGRRLQPEKQTLVNIIIAIWWVASVCLNIILAWRTPFHDQKTLDSEHLLIADHASPAGFKVPSLPDYEIDPSFGHTGIRWLPKCVELVFGMVLAAAVCAGLLLLSFSDWD